MVRGASSALGRIEKALLSGAAADSIEPWVVANALIGINRAGVDYARQRITDGARNPGLARSVRRQITRAVAALDQGLADYGTSV